MHAYLEFCQSFLARNEQEEQEEKREIKRRLTRKVRNSFVLSFVATLKLWSGCSLPYTSLMCLFPEKHIFQTLYSLQGILQAFSLGNSFEVLNVDKRNQQRKLSKNHEEFNKLLGAAKIEERFSNTRDVANYILGLVDQSPRIQFSLLFFVLIHSCNGVSPKIVFF